MPRNKFHCLNFTGMTLQGSEAKEAVPKKPCNLYSYFTLLPQGILWPFVVLCGSLLLVLQGCSCRRGSFRYGHFCQLHSCSSADLGSSDCAGDFLVTRKSTRQTPRAARGLVARFKVLVHRWASGHRTSACRAEAFQQAASANLARLLCSKDFCTGGWRRERSPFPPLIGLEQLDPRCPEAILRCSETIMRTPMRRTAVCRNWLFRA